ncbi:MAG: hypothetical protein ACJAR2_002897 [Ilumatobacter sp.]
MESNVCANELATKSEALSVFVRRRSAQVFAVAALALVVLRIFIGEPNRGDAAVLLVILAAVGPVEWVIHRYLLHADENAWTSRRLGIGVGHRNHHIDPHDLNWLLVAGRDAAALVMVFGLMTWLWVVVLSAFTGTAVIGSFVTAWALTALALTHYEWIHLLVHTRYRCRTKYFKRLGANHRLHHYRNEHYWLGVTTNTGDRMLNTYPASSSDVPLSATARTLDRAADSS